MHIRFLLTIKSVCSIFVSTNMRTRVRAIIIKDENIILIKRTKKDEIYFVFPGGGVEEGETEKEALVREIKEELGLDTEVKELTTSRPLSRSNADQIEYFYLCDVIGGVLGTGNGPEFQENSKSEYDGIHEVISIPLSEISQLNLMPFEVRDLVVKMFSKTS